MGAVGRVAEHALSGRGPDVAVDVAAEAVEEAVIAGGERRRRADRTSVGAQPVGGDGHRQVPDMGSPGVGDVENAFIRRKRQAVGLHAVGDDGGEGAAVGIEPIDVGAADLRGRLQPFIIAVDAVGGIAEPHRAVRLDDRVVGRVQPFAFEAVRQHGDRSVMLGAGHPSGQVFATDQPALPVGGVAVGILAWLPEYRHRSVGLVEPHHTVIGNVGPHQITPGGEVGRTFRPAATGGEFVEIGMADDARGEPRIVNDERPHEMLPD